MMRIFALVASAVGYWYLSTGSCDPWSNKSLRLSAADLVMTIGFVYTIGKNIIEGKPLVGVWSVIWAVITWIYWWTFSWSNENIFACKGPKAILIGGTTIFLLFVVNTVVDYKGWATTKEEIRKNFEEEIDESFD